MRLDRIFTHRLIMTPLASYVGFAAMLVAAYSLITGAASAWWLVPLVIMTFMILMAVTVGMHRLFCHQAFKTSQLWHWIMGYLGTIAIYGSTVQWPAMHMSHHEFSDTPKDPHYTGWQYLFWKKNNPTIFNRRVLTRLYRQPMHRFLHQYYVLVVLGTVIVLGLISPWLLLFGYLAPLGWLHLVGSFHQVYAHGKQGARDLPIMEALMFTGGEWLHGHHHRWPKDLRFGTADAGYTFIQLIRRRPRHST
jgi:stearoyl-CoA desaturase (delta-9 desaturase)